MIERKTGLIRKKEIKSFHQIIKQITVQTTILKTLPQGCEIPGLSAYDI